MQNKQNSFSTYYMQMEMLFCITEWILMFGPVEPASEKSLEHKNNQKNSGLEKKCLV